ncbi:hypothetical protein [Bacillus sp. FJAT-26390]|uniref:hypothetical protein n=1 Tax=Bacillus sp. FJAT-26390 TaxID=1743142 RepID=UPI00159EED97|nr:hypothetical protein [Bacillus sp. FJAT-26390]
MYELSKIIFMLIVIVVTGGIAIMSLPSGRKVSSTRRVTPVFTVIKAEINRR